ncbi:unnamed protein product [Discosporangium mesarthrocarpum]
MVGVLSTLMAAFLVRPSSPGTLHLSARSKEGLMLVNRPGSSIGWPRPCFRGTRLFMQDLSLRSYWDRLYSSEGRPMEWHLEFDSLVDTLECVLGPASPSTHVLMVGCGNSNLSESMYDHGWRHITNIDFSEECIRSCKWAEEQREAKGRSRYFGMSWMVMDACDMTFDDGTFHGAVDKGTMDAITCSEGFDWYLTRMAKELVRVLRPGGRWVCVSFTPPSVALPLLREAEGWQVEVKDLSTFRLYIGTKGKVIGTQDMP